MIQNELMTNTVNMLSQYTVPTSTSSQHNLRRIANCHDFLLFSSLLYLTALISEWVRLCSQLPTL